MLRSVLSTVVANGHIMAMRTWLVQTEVHCTCELHTSFKRPSMKTKNIRYLCSHPDSVEEYEEHCSPYVEMLEPKLLKPSAH